VEAVSPQQAKAEIDVKMGAMSMTFTGTVEIVERDDEARRAVLKGKPITYANGQLTLNDVTRPIDVTFDGASGRALIKQTDFKIKPYSALFGTLKVADAVEVKVRTHG
jgi:carbon monoxide dehydrogenase subunit G